MPIISVTFSHIVYVDGSSPGPGISFTERVNIPEATIEECEKYFEEAVPIARTQCEEKRGHKFKSCRVRARM